MRERDQAHSLSCASRLAKSVYVWQPTRHLREERCKREGEGEESQLEEEAAQRERVDEEAGEDAPEHGADLVVLGQLTTTEQAGSSRRLDGAALLAAARADDEDLGAIVPVRDHVLGEDAVLAQLAVDLAVLALRGKRGSATSARDERERERERTENVRCCSTSLTLPTHSHPSRSHLYLQG